jgi:hypothetical protein
VVSAGSQGQAGGPFAWTNRGWGFLADADGGSITISVNSFSFSRNASPEKRDIKFYLIVENQKKSLRDCIRSQVCLLFSQSTLSVL